MICDEANVDVRELIGLANRHPRQCAPAGRGCRRTLYSGGSLVHCQPISEQARLVRLARERNLAKTSWCLAKIKDLIGRTENEVGRLPNVALQGLLLSPILMICEVART